MQRALLKQNAAKTFSILFFALMLTGLLFSPHPTSAQTGAYYDKHFEWDYKGQHWTWNLSIPVQLYNTYKAVPVANRTQYGPAGYGFCTTTDDPYVQSLAKELNDTSNRLGYGAFDKISFTLAFVQSLPYTSDSVTTGYDEYPRFPIETLVDDGGDCEDTSILFASLTLIMGFGTVYINPPGHYAVGISGSNLRGTYWTYPEGSNTTYYYCETTGNGFMIGEMPSQFLGQSVNIYNIDANKQFIPQLDPASPSDQSDAVTTLPKNTPEPTTKIDSSSSTVAQPSSEPFLPPPSLSIITDNPLLYILGLFSLAVGLGFAFTAVRNRGSKTHQGSA